MSKKIVDNIKGKHLSIILVAAFAIIGISIIIFTKAATPNTGTGGVQSLAGGNATLDLSPASGSYSTGANFVVSIIATSDTDSMGTVDARLTYDPSKLTFVSVNNSGGAFTNCFENSGGNGSVTLTCSKLSTALSGKQKVGEATFTTKVSGTATINFGTNSLILKGDGGSTNLWDGNTSGGTYTVTAPSTGGGGGGGGGGTTTPPPTSSTGGGTKTTTDPKSTTTAPKSTASTTPTAPDPVTGEPVPIAAGVNTYSVAITVSDKGGKAVAGATVTLNGSSLVTDASGIATFAGLTAGKYKVTVDSEAGKVNKEITVVEGSATEVQAVSLEVQKGFNFVLYIGLAALLILLVVFLKLFQKWSRERAEHNRRFGGMASKVHVGGQEEPVEADEPVTIANTTVVAPKDEPEVEKPLSAPNPAIAEVVNSNETLDEIEKKVGSSKVIVTNAVPETPKQATVSANEFEPNLIVPKKKTLADNPDATSRPKNA